MQSDNPTTPSPSSVIILMLLPSGDVSTLAFILARGRSRVLLTTTYLSGLKLLLLTNVCFFSLMYVVKFVFIVVSELCVGPENQIVFIARREREKQLRLDMDKAQVRKYVSTRRVR